MIFLLVRLIEIYYKYYMDDQGKMVIVLAIGVIKIEDKYVC